MHPLNCYQMINANLRNNSTQWSFGIWQFPHLKSFVDNQIRGVIVIEAAKLNHREKVARLCHWHKQQYQGN